MLRLVLSQGLVNLVGLAWPALAELHYRRYSHRAMLQATIAAEGAFADSGYWDFALLSLYDHWVRRLILGGLTAISELGWTERALVVSTFSLDFSPTHSPLSLMRNLGAMFSHYGVNFAILFAALAAYYLTGGEGPFRAAEAGEEAARLLGELGAALASPEHLL